MALRTKLIVNLTQERCVCVGELAESPLARMRGLLGRSGLPAGEGMLLSPAPSIHTAFMRFPIDAVFLDRDFRVLGIVEGLSPWRVASRRRARAVLELAAGECARRGIHVGDRLGLRERRPASEQAAGDRAQAGEARELLGEGAPRPGGESVIWPAPSHEEPRPARTSPMRVLVISRDGHFRSVTSTLLAHRGCSVTATAKATLLEKMISAGEAHVVVIDASDSPTGAQTLAADGAMAQPVGVVIVGEVADLPRSPAVLAKWGPFEDLFAAIEKADQVRGRHPT